MTKFNLYPLHFISRRIKYAVPKFSLNHISVWYLRASRNPAPWASDSRRPSACKYGGEGHIAKTGAWNQWTQWVPPRDVVMFHQQSLRLWILTRERGPGSSRILVVVKENGWQNNFTRRTDKQPSQRNSFVKSHLFIKELATSQMAHRLVNRLNPS